MRRTLVLLFLGALAPALQGQSTWYVDVNSTPPGDGSPSWPYSSIQYAIDQPTTIEKDTLSIAPGTYDENLALVGKALHLFGEQGADMTILDGRGRGSCLSITGDVGWDVMIEGLTFTGGSGTATGFGSAGGAVYADGSYALFSDCVFDGNTCDPAIGFGRGGAVYAKDGGRLSLSGCELNGNLAVGGDGQAVYAVDMSDGCYLWGSAFTNNGQLNVAGDSGALYCEGSELYVSECLFEGNQTPGAGGAILLYDAPAWIDLSELDNNTAGGPGGAIFLTDHSGSKLSLQLCELDDNRSARGGAVYQSTGYGMIEQCSFSDNQVLTTGGEDALGGALYLGATTGTRVLGSIFGGNEAVAVGHFDGLGGAIYGPVDLEFCTLIGNQALGMLPEGGAMYGPGSLDSCIVWSSFPDALAGGPTADWSDVQGGWPGQDNLDEDPLLLPSLALGPNSPCIDTGNPLANTDPDGSRADMGALPWTWITVGISYCDSNPNSSGLTAQLTARGSASLADNFLVLDTVQLPVDRFGMIIFSDVQGFVPLFGGGDGNLCLGGNIVRNAKDVLSSGPGGQIVFQPDLNNLPNGTVILSGETWNFQLWFRDVGSTSNTSDGVEVLFMN